VLDASEIKLLVDGQDLPPIKPLPAKTDDGVQQVIKPERLREKRRAAGDGVMQLSAVSFQFLRAASWPPFFCVSSPVRY